MSIAALATREVATVTPRPDRGGERHGRQVFDERVDEDMKGQMHEIGTMRSLQLSVALVLRSGSGVGKTYATQTARYGSLRLQEKRKEEAEQHKQPCEDCPYDLYSAYIGFNVGESLQSEEEEYMQRMRSAEGVAVVVLTRLLAWLAAFVASFCPEGEADRPEGKGEDWDAVMQPQYPVADAAVAAMPYAKMHGDTTATRDLLLGKVEGCLRALANARKAAGQKPLALLVAVDEGQKLDKLEGCEPYENGGGARWALHVLRELQRTALSCGVALLPICTGINPEVSLGDGTDGMNMVLREAGAVVMLPNEWRDYCEEHLGKKTKLFSSRPAVHAFYALLWPRARHVATIAEGPSTVLKTQVASLDWSYPNRKGEEYDARGILKAAADQTKSACGIPQNMVRYGDVPVVDFCMFTHFTEKLELTTFFKAAPEASAFLQKKPLTLQAVCKLAREHAAFEHFAFNVLAAFAALFYHEQPDQKYVPEGRWTKQLTNWMPRGPATFKFCGPLSSSKPNRHPLTTITGDRLSEEFNAKLEELQEMNDAIFLHCGGEAKIDFLLLKVTDVVGTVRTLAVRFADAKHAQVTNSTSTKKQTAFYFADPLRDITAKALEVHAGLRSSLPKGYNLTAFEARHVLIVTNKTLVGHDSDMLKVIPDELQQVVNPQTTQWLPLTVPLFGIESLKKVCAGI